MTGTEYRHAIASYLASMYGERGIAVYEEVKIGKTMVGKQRGVDVFVVHETRQLALAIECKYQEVQGTADEKIPFALSNMDALPMPACVVYAGNGFSAGILHLLEASPLAAYCHPSRKQTWQLDHVMAMTFSWFDVLVKHKAAVGTTKARLRLA